MAPNVKHELFAELDMFCKNWQTRYAHLKEAAVAAGCMDLYEDWLRSPAGQEYRQMLQATYDLFKERNAGMLSERAIEDMAVAMDLAGPITEGEDE
jgi:hypothetical protein